jgi:hypothetical protein
MQNSEHKSALTWPAAWFIGAVLLYFVIIPLGIEVPSYVTQSPDLFPKALAILIGALAILQFTLEWRGLGSKKVEQFSILFFVTPVIASIFAWALAPIGFPITASFALAALFIIFGERRPLVIVGLSGVTAIGIHLIFVYALNIPMPSGILG